MKKNLRKVFAVSMAGAMVAGCIPAMADEAASTTNWEPFAETVTLRVPVYDRGAEGVPDVSNNYWTGWIQENFGDQYNIKVEYVPITRSDVMHPWILPPPSAGNDVISYLISPCCQIPLMSFL